MAHTPSNPFGSAAVLKSFAGRGGAAEESEDPWLALVEGPTIRLRHSGVKRIYAMQKPHIRKRCEA